MKKKLLVLLLATMISGVPVMPADAMETEVFSNEIESLTEAEEQIWNEYSYIVLEDGTVEITKYSGTDTIVTIPTEIDGKDVTAISYEVFAYQNNITELNLPKNLKVIKGYAFMYCTNLKEIVIPEGVEEIGGSAFYGCWKLEKVSIPKSILSIGEGSFGDCRKLRDITLEQNDAVGLDNGVLYDKKTNVMIFYCGASDSVVLPKRISRIGRFGLSGRSDVTSIVLPEGLKSIGNMAFENCSGITRIVLPGAMETIESTAFFNCSNLKEIVLSDSLQSIGYRAFAYCMGLEKIVVSEKNPYFMTIGGDLYTKDRKTLVCCVSNVKTYTIPDGVEVIGSAAFDNCENLQTVQIPDSVNKVDGFAFDTCSNLTQVELSKNVKEIGCRAFLRCNSLQNVVIINPDCVIYDAADTIPENAIIVGYQGSTAQKYAEKYGKEFQDINSIFLFKDVPLDSWQYKGVKYVFDNKIMSGFSATEFGANEKLSREQFVQVLYNNSGKPAVNSNYEFPDVKNAWYKNAVLWAKENGIANGQGDGNFGIGKSITRQDLAVMLYKYAKLKGYDLTATDGLIEQYADDNKVSKYAVEAMNWAVTQGVITGKGKKGEDISTFNLDPIGTATRAECATMIMKLLEKNK